MSRPPLNSESVSTLDPISLSPLEHLMRFTRCSIPYRFFKDGASFCYCAYVSCISGYSGFLRNLPPNRTMYLLVYDYVEKADLSKGYQNPKRKLGVTTHYSEIIELKLEKKLPYILCILTLFENYGCLIAEPAR